jgi:predicted enzyme related to lactoylglutathione lyase
MPRVVHFEIHVDDPERAVAFYKRLFDWQFAKWEGGPIEYWLITTGPDGQPGINGGLMRRPGAVEGQGMITYICTIDVPDLDKYLATAIQNGGTVCKPKAPIPGFGWLAYAKDTEGNVFGMMQLDPTAK